MQPTLLITVGDQSRSAVMQEVAKRDLPSIVGVANLEVSFPRRVNPDLPFTVEATFPKSLFRTNPLGSLSPVLKEISEAAGATYIGMCVRWV